MAEPGSADLDHRPPEPDPAGPDGDPDPNGVVSQLFTVIEHRQKRRAHTPSPDAPSPIPSVLDGTPGNGAGAVSGALTVFRHGLASTGRSARRLSGRRSPGPGRHGSGLPRRGRDRAAGRAQGDDGPRAPRAIPPRGASRDRGPPPQRRERPRVGRRPARALRGVRARRGRHSRRPAPARGAARLETGRDARSRGRPRARGDPRGGARPPRHQARQRAPRARGRQGERPGTRAARAGALHARAHPHG